MLGPEIKFADREHILYKGQKLQYLGGTDYHRMSRNPILIKSTAKAANNFGLNPTGSRATTGNHSIYNQLEKKIAEFFGSESAAVLPCGYLSNAILLQSIYEDYDLLLLDENAHPSIVDAASLVSTQFEEKIFRFKSKNPQHLEDQLKKLISPNSKPLIMTDGVFPNDGDIPPLKDYLQVISNFDGKILLDDAHGMAVVGKTGKGSWEEKGIDRNLVFQTGTLSKGFGAYGGIIPGKRSLIDQIYASSAFIGSTGLALPLASAAYDSVSHLGSNLNLIVELQEKAKKLKKEFRDLGFPMPASSAPIFSITFHDEIKNNRLYDLLIKNDIYPPFINYPGAPTGGHFRFIITSTTTTDQIDLLVDTIRSSI